MKCCWPGLATGATNCYRISSRCPTSRGLISYLIPSENWLQFTIEHGHSNSWFTRYLRYVNVYQRIVEKSTKWWVNIGGIYPYCTITIWLVGSMWKSQNVDINRDKLMLVSYLHSIPQLYPLHGAKEKTPKIHSHITSSPYIPYISWHTCAYIYIYVYMYTHMYIHI